jgi:hydrogenase maturation protease
MNAEGVLLVGYGNVLRGDDAVGPRVAELLAAEERLAGATIEVHHQLTPELAEDIASARLVVLVDAGNVGDAPGDVNVERVFGHRRALGTHTLDVSVLVGLAEQLYGHTPPVILVSVGAERFDLGADLSPAVASKLVTVVDNVVDVVEYHLGAASHVARTP